MKTTFYTVLLTLFSIPLLIAQTTLEGYVGNSNGEPLSSAYVALYQNDKLIKSAETNRDGKYIFVDIEAGTYEIETHHTGYVTQRILDIIVEANKVTQKNIILMGGGLEEVKLEEEEFEDIMVSDLSIEGRKVTADEIRSLPTKNINAIATSIAGASSSASGISIRSSRSAMTEYYVDGVRVSNIRGFDKSALPESGQMTAGEWNDLHNWRDWMALLEEENYGIMMERFAIFPTERYSVIVVNENNAVLANEPVVLLDDKRNIIWKTYTDNSGRAELWDGAFGEELAASSIVVRDQKLTDIVKIDEGSNTIVLKNECYSPDKMDIAFVVDATSSMSDEINYLKSELLDVISRIEEANENMDFNIGSVFYRDKSDDYLTRVSPLSPVAEETVNFVGNQDANGGSATSHQCRESRSGRAPARATWRS